MNSPTAPPAPVWSLYVLRTRAGALYAGISIDVERRLAEHGRGGQRGARALRAQGPLRLVYSVVLGERGTALRAEYRFKRLPKAAKESLVAAQPSPQVLLGRLQLEA